MSALLPAIAASVLALSVLWTLGGLAAIAATRRRRLPSSSGRLPPVSVLKPLSGADPSLEQNLETFFGQDHAGFEIVFGVERADDPAVPVARRVMRRHPGVAARLVVHHTPTGMNPKVRNLRGMLPHALHDLVLVSDSNVRVGPGYVREMVATLVAEPGVGVVTSLIAGADESSSAGALEAVQMCGFVAAGTTLPTVFGDAAVVGKSMLFSRRELARLGGLERVADLLAEDHVLGKTFQHAGRRVAIARTPIVNVIGPVSLGAIFERHVRWSLIRWRLRPLAHLAELATSPLALAPLLSLCVSPWLAFGVGLGVAWARDVGGWLLLRGAAGVHLPVLLAPLRDLFALAVWLVAPLRRHVRWRGHCVRVGAGTLLFEVAERADDAQGPGAFPVRA